MKILIIGQGLAGSVLAYRLFFDYGITDLTIIDAQQNGSSAASSGIMNPVTGRRIVKTWQHDLLFPAAVELYKDAEIRFGKSLISDREIIRFFESNQEYNDFTVKSAEPVYRPFIVEEENPREAQHVKNVSGAGKIVGVYTVKVMQFIESVRAFFKQENKLITDSFDYSVVSENVNVINYNGQKYDCAVFCEGYHAVNNVPFNYLPFRPAKGDVFIANIPSLPQERLIKKGIFFLPLGEHNFWVGAPYISNNLSTEPSEQGINFLKEKIAKAIGDVPYSVQRILTGIRPATKDRKPFLGKHPKMANKFIFNGFGTKGVSLSPWAATQFCEFLINKKPLPTEIDINRFKADL